MGPPWWAGKLADHTHMTGGSRGMFTQLAVFGGIDMRGGPHQLDS